MRSLPFVLAAALLGCGGASGGADDPVLDASAPDLDAAPGGFRPDGVVTLVAGEVHANGVVADEDAVYWIRTPPAGAEAPTSAVRKLDLRTRQVTTLVADAGGAFRIFADADELFVGTGESGDIIAVSKRDGTTRVVTTATGDVRRLALDHDEVVYTVQDGPGSVAVRSVRKDGSDPRELGRIDADNPYDVVLDDGFAYVAGEVALYAVPRTGGEPVMIVDGVFGSASNLALDADHVYFSDRVRHWVSRVPKTGGARQPILDGIRTPNRMAVADGRLYVAARGGVLENDGLVVRVPVTGGTPEVIAANLSRPAEISLLQGAIVWSVLGHSSTVPAGGIMAAPR